MRHPEVRVRVANMHAKIDVLLAPLIKEMWKSMIITDESCQEFEPGMAAIWFPDEHEFKKFMNAVGDNTQVDDMSSLYRRMNPPYDFQGPAWQYGVMIEENNICDAKGGCDFQIAMMVMFPQSDIPLLVEILRERA